MLATSSIIEDGTSVGEGTTFGYFTHVLSGCSFGRNCKIGDNVFIASNTHFSDNVVIGSGTVFCNTEARSQLFKKEHIGKEATVVEKDVVIGSGVRIVGNTVIKQGSIVADGSTVIGYVWAHTFVAGNPARKIYSLSSIK